MTSNAKRRRSAYEDYETATEFMSSWEISPQFFRQANRELKEALDYEYNLALISGRFRKAKEVYRILSHLYRGYYDINESFRKLDKILKKYPYLK